MMTITVADIIAKIKEVHDVEIPVDIVELGLIYGVDIKDKIIITMSFTSPTCTYSEILVSDVKSIVEKTFNKECEVKVVFSPAWNLTFMSEEAQFILDITQDQIEESVKASQKFEENPEEFYANSIMSSMNYFM